VFEIAVFSDPVNALVGDGGFLEAEELHRTAEYDESFVKPALLLADKVVLRSHRIDLIANDIRDHNMLAYPVPLLSRSLGISARHDRGELKMLGITEDVLLSSEEIDEVNRVIAHSKSDDEWVRAMERCKPIEVALRSFFKRHGELMISPTLNSMSEILDQRPWDPKPKTQPQKILDGLQGENAEFDRAFLSMAEDVSNSATSVMMDDSVSGDLTRFEGSAREFDSATTVRGAVDLMRLVSGVAEMRLDEIPEVRTELAPYLTPFRAFMLDVSSSAELSGVSESERSRQLVLAWERDVQPAVVELEATLQSASFRNNAIDVFANSGETLKTVGVAIGLVMGSGLIGISSLTALGAVAPPVLNAFVRSVRARQSAKRNRAYFVHALGERMRAAAKRKP
jgi:hypothetical protein